jgi:hypothetical protein
VAPPGSADDRGMIRSVSEAQCADALFVVRPATCMSNPETRATNAFQRDAPVETADPDAEFRLGRRPHVREAVLHEFDQLAALLGDALRVHVYADTPDPPKPDAVFPNNWFSTHADGTVVLYPMLAPSRRRERRRDLIDALGRDGPYRVSRIVDLSHFERRGEFLEGTGSLVLDRAHRIAYACRSPRTHDAPLAAFAQQLGYEVVAFDAAGPDGAPVYHTNVVMWLGERVAGVCSESIADAAQRRAVLDRLAATHEVVEISMAQMGEYCGNMLAVRSRTGDALLEMSHRAYHALTDAQRATLHRHFRWLTAHPVYTIERLGGGSVRCMLAEVFLPRA